MIHVFGIHRYGIDRQAIAKTALLGLAEPLWSFVPSGSKGHIDFGELYPYDPDKAKALLKETGYDKRNPYGQKTRNRLDSGGYDLAIARALACMLPTPSRILNAD